MRLASSADVLGVSSTRHITLKSVLPMKMSYGEFWITEPWSTSPRFSTAEMVSVGLQKGSE